MFHILQTTFFKKNPKEVLKKIVKDYQYSVTKSKIIRDYSILAYKIAKIGSEWNDKDKIEKII